VLSCDLVLELVAMFQVIELGPLNSGSPRNECNLDLRCSFGMKSLSNEEIRLLPSLEVPERYKVIGLSPQGHIYIRSPWPLDWLLCAVCVPSFRARRVQATKLLREPVKTAGRINR
jgi:hypothetical protein